MSQDRVAPEKSHCSPHGQTAVNAVRALAAHRLTAGMRNQNDRKSSETAGEPTANERANTAFSWPPLRIPAVHPRSPHNWFHPSTPAPISFPVGHPPPSIPNSAAPHVVALSPAPCSLDTSARDAFIRR